MIFEIDVIIFCMYIVTLLISSLFSNVSVLKYDVVSSNKDTITIVSARSGDISKTIDIKKKFYINADDNNQISALKTNGGKIIYIPNYLYNYKGVLSGLVLSTVSLFIIFVFITFYMLFRLAKKRSELKLAEGY